MEASKEERAYMVREGLSYQPHMPWVLVIFISLGIAALGFWIGSALNG